MEREGIGRDKGEKWRGDRETEQIEEERGTELWLDHFV